VGLITWWIVEKIVNNSDTWWQITMDSLATVLMEWTIVLAVLVGLNWWLSPLVIHRPQNPTLAKILGFFFVLSPPKMFVPPTPSVYTPKVIPTVSGHVQVKGRWLGAYSYMLWTYLLYITHSK
jgi:hypothetical protein